MTNELISLNSSIPQNCYVGDPYPYYQPIIERYYTSYPIYQTWVSPEKSKVEQAFRIVQKLVENKVLELKTVKQFIECVNDVVGCL